jgi:hypothetical protein
MDGNWVRVSQPMSRNRGLDSGMARTGLTTFPDEPRQETRIGDNSVSDVLDSTEEGKTRIAAPATEGRWQFARRGP